MFRAKILLVLASILLAPIFLHAAETLDLAGQWRFSLDRQNQGVTGRWFDQNLSDKITLPGILESQGYGDEISTSTPWVLSLYDHFWFEREDYKAYTKPGNTKVPFLSQPPRHYTGAAWYQRDIDVPESWRGKHFVLFLERPHWETTVWLDDKKIGSARSLVAPHEHDLGIVEPGRHRISIRVDNSMILPYRPDAHSVSDSLGMAWNGIVGKIELKATPPVWIDDIQVFTTEIKPPLKEAQTPPEDIGKMRIGHPRPGEYASATIKIKIKIGNATHDFGWGKLRVKGQETRISWDVNGANREFEIEYPIAFPWDEFHQTIQKISVELITESFTDTREVSFGFRDLKADGKKFLLNGREVYFRGTHHGGDFPLTGYPPTDVAYWKKIFQINKDWGINHIRFHSFCPPEAAFQAADEVGIYLQPEPGMWNEVSPGTPMEKMLYDETDAMIRAYGNHPSYLMLAPSNEPKGRWKESFDKWIAHYREVDPRRLYNNGTGHTEREVPGLAEGTDFITMQRVGQKMLRGNSAWFGQDYGKSLDDINVPVLSHELGQWIAYPDYDVIKKFTGYMHPENYEIFRDSLAAHGLAARNKDFAYASGRYQLECYKEEIEANLRTPGMSGFQLLDLHDYLGQGTALVGILDAFWEEKGYATAKEFRRFNNTTVPLARLKKRIFTDGESIEADLEIAHFGEKPLENAVPYEKIVDQSGKVLKSVELPARTIPIGKNIQIDKLNFALSGIQQPVALKVIFGLKGTEFENDWDVWVYPSPELQKPARSKGVDPATAPGGVLITHDWPEAEAALKKGSKVLYMPRKADLDWTSPPLDTVPVFWNRLMNPAWGRMLGLWIDKNHPALALFPTKSYFDWQWTEPVRGARTVNLDRLPKDLQPIVQPIDDWNRNYKLGMIFEAKVGSGKLVVSSADLENDLDRRIVARQLRRSVLEYMAGSRFNPKTSVAAEDFRKILFPTRIMKRLGATAAATGDAANAIDGDPNTFWTAGEARDPARKNQELTITFPNAVAFSGFVIMPRQNGREHEGDVRDYLIQVSDDGTTWRELKRGGLLSTFDPQRIDLGQTVTSRYIKFTSLSGFGTDKLTALAELTIIYTGPPLPPDATDLEYKQVKSASPDIDEGPRKP